MIEPKTPLSRLLNEKREEILALCAKYGATNVRVFGSVARGEDRPDSDVDLLVEMEKGRSLFDFISLWQDVERLLGRKVDMGTPRSLKPRIRPHVLAHAAAL